MDKSFSVLTVTRRTGWEAIGLESMRRQTARRDKWVIVSENPLTLPFIKAPPKRRGMKSNMVRSENHGLKKIKSDYVIFYQDYIDLPKDCFKKLLELATPNTFVTTATINHDGTMDARYLGVDCPRPCTPEEWESNVALAPMKIVKELGGFDEEYDQGFAWDNCNLAERAAMLGCEFVLDESNKPQLFNHDRSMLPPNGDFHAQRMREVADGARPIKCKYL